MKVPSYTVCKTSTSLNKEKRKKEEVKARTYADSRNFPQWRAADAEIKVPSIDNTELEGSPFKARGSQYITIHATLTARDFLLANFYPSDSFTCIFFQNLSRVFHFSLVPV